MSDIDQKKIFSRNLNRYIAQSGKSQKEIADKIGVSPQTFNTWCQGIAFPRVGKIQLLSDFFGINKSDLIDKHDSVKLPTNRIPVYGSVPAGIPIEAIEDVVDWEDLGPDMANDGHTYIGLKVRGESMKPKYIDGDTIIVRIQPDCENGQDAVVYVNGYDATLKRILKRDDGIMLQPINVEYEPQVYYYGEDETPVRILGVVVELRRKI